MRSRSTGQSRGWPDLALGGVAVGDGGGDLLEPAALRLAPRLAVAGQLAALGGLGDQQVEGLVDDVADVERADLDGLLGRLDRLDVQHPLDEPGVRADGVPLERGRGDKALAAGEVGQVVGAGEVAVEPGEVARAAGPLELAGRGDDRVVGVAGRGRLAHRPLLAGARLVGGEDGSREGGRTVQPALRGVDALGPLRRGEASGCR